MVGADRKTVAALFLVLLAAAACVKDKPNPPVTLPPGDGGRRIFVACEGSMGNGNSALTLFLPEKGTIVEDVYPAANQQSALGDVFQSMTRIGDEWFLCINNSDKIIVVDKEYRRQAVISIPKPRYVVAVSTQKAFVSTLFSNKVYVINPQTRQVLQSISMPRQNPEGMMLCNGKLWVATWDTATKNVYLVDTTTFQVTDSVAAAGSAPQEMVQDKDGRVWILSGNIPKGKAAALTVVNPSDKTTLKFYAFPAGADPIRPVMTPAKDVLYFIGVNYNGGTQYNGVFRMNIDAPSLPQQPFIAAQAMQYFWALGIDPLTGNIYVGDPKGFVQKGRLNIYTPDGTLSRSFATGVGPGHIYFD